MLVYDKIKQAYHKVKTTAKTIVKSSETNRSTAPLDFFHADYYLRHNQRRQEHLATLGLDLVNKTVLEVGAGIGDHSSFFFDRNCNVLITEARQENLDIIKTRYPQAQIANLDLDDPKLELHPLEIVYCYGLLYHLNNPARAIEYMAGACKDLLLLETCVSFGNESRINLCSELVIDPTQAVSGTGCRPTRVWIFEQLKQYFEFVYMRVTQPYHDQFPIDWQPPPEADKLTRSIFIASRQRLDNSLLLAEVPMQQRRG